MVPGPAFDHAVSLFGNGVPRSVGMGLHITLNSEWDFPRWGPVLPAGAVPSLLDERGCFFKTPALMQARGVVAAEMLAEIEAQIKLARSRGLPIEYIDEHMIVSRVSEEVRAGIAALARRHGLIDAVGLGLRGLPAGSPPRTDDLAADWIARLERAAAAGGGTFLCVTHPMMNDEEARAFSSSNTPRWTKSSGDATPTGVPCSIRESAKPVSVWGWRSLAIAIWPFDGGQAGHPQEPSGWL